eukprot:6187660-Pleurochrysis_carterae.AAC.1
MPKPTPAAERQSLKRKRGTPAVCCRREGGGVLGGKEENDEAIWQGLTKQERSVKTLEVNAKREHGGRA